ncbi:MAG: SDR family oxidoreductase [Proteobacteria bacterium]|nr:MAG: SDR family oxidoreductase [Pseudomonadota bacterium]
MDLENKVAYITGGTKGIGFGTAKVLVDAGMRVAISGRKLADAQQAAQLLGNESRAFGVESDVTDFASEEKAVASVKSHFGQLDVVLANAGVGIFSPIDTLSIDDWNQMINTNLTGAFHTLKASIEALKQSKGYYISLASLAGTNFFESASGYNASKFGVVGFTQAAMLDLRKFDIKVSTIMPGSVATNFNNHVPTDADSWKIQPEDIGQIVLDLLKMNPRTLPSKIEVRPTRPGGN